MMKNSYEKVVDLKTENGEEIMRLTILHASDNDRPTSKIIYTEDGNDDIQKLTCTPSFQWTVEQKQVGSIHDIYSVLEDLSSNPLATIIRGEPFLDLDLSQPVLRRKDAKDGIRAHRVHQPLR